MLGFEAPVEVTFDALFVDSSSMCCSAPFFFSMVLHFPQGLGGWATGGAGVAWPKEGGTNHSYCT